MKTQINGVTLGKKGVRYNGVYYPVWYSHYKSAERAFVDITAKDLVKGLPEALRPVNNTDITEDYFERDRVTYEYGTPEYNAILSILG